MTVAHADVKNLLIVLRAGFGVATGLNSDGRDGRSAEEKLEHLRRVRGGIEHYKGCEKSTGGTNREIVLYLRFCCGVERFRRC
jgi:hypothetical protein